MALLGLQRLLSNKNKDTLETKVDELARELEQTKQKLQDARREINSVKQAKNHFLEVMSNELRTPMKNMFGMTDMLQSDNLSVEDRKKYAKSIHDTVQNLLGQFNDILDLTKIEAGKLSLARVACYPGMVAQDTVNLFAELSRKSGLRLDTTLHIDATQTYLSDPIRLRQMLSNLISNAFKFTDDGFINIEVREVSRVGKNALLEFSVCDSSFGIPVEKHPSLFKNFQYFAEGTEHQFGRTALRLSLVRAMAELMGGTVGFESELGHGARLWFRIQAELVNQSLQSATPKKIDESELVAKQLSPKESSFQGEILVVDDNAVNCMIIENLLKQFGLQVQIAENGQQAFEKIKTGFRPTMILMDCQMPVMDGFEATHAIRAWERSQHLAPLTIVALTASISSEEREKCISAGMDDFLSKPISLYALHKVLLERIKPS